MKKNKLKIRDKKKKVAIIGAGISGLTLAYLLSKKYNITLYEENNYLGGHACTLEKEIIQENKKINIAFDIGFLVYNNKNYPLFSNLINTLNVKSINSDMSFSVSNKHNKFEYSSNGILGSTNNLKNILNLDFWIMLKDIKKFYMCSKKILYNKKSVKKNLIVNEFLKEYGFSEVFINEHFLPMCASIWSISSKRVLKMPIYTIIIFFNNHGLLSFFGKPQWKTIKGGSKRYVNAITKRIKGEIHLNEKVLKVNRNRTNIEIISKNITKSFDKVVFATHADDTLSLLGKPFKEEINILSKFKYENNIIYVHQDERLMPSNKKVWSSWNVANGKDYKSNNVCVTYWINKLQSIKTMNPLLVTLNADKMMVPKKDKIIQKLTFRHPIFTKESEAVKTKVDSIQGKNNSYFIGAWRGYGFHEDGVLSANNLLKYFKIKDNS